MIVVIVLDALNGGDCRETRCHPDGPAIRFPFRLKGRQPIHCGFPGFDVSCTDDNQTILELPSSSAKFFVDAINYTSHTIRGRAYYGCLPRELFYSKGSYPFQFVGRTPLFSCPPSTVHDYTSDISDEIGVLHWSIPSCEHCK
ncbi:PREDICTED: rust resistance kinase Lr10, partial [Prunus dulcis]